MSKQQLEIDHCRAVCDELRAKLNTCVADTLEREAEIFLQESAQLCAAGEHTASRYALNASQSMRDRAALARAGGVL